VFCSRGGLCLHRNKGRECRKRGGNSGEPTERSGNCAISGKKIPRWGRQRFGAADRGRKYGEFPVVFIYPHYAQLGARTKSQGQGRVEEPFRQSARRAKSGRGGKRFQKKLKQEQGQGNQAWKWGALDRGRRRPGYRQAKSIAESGRKQ